MVCNPIPEELIGATVADLWNRSDWKWNLIAYLLPAETLSKLKSQKLMSESAGVDDRIFWAESSSGVFTTNSAMKLLRTHQQEGNFEWALIWKAPTQQRVRNFLHLVVHDSILCNATRFRRHIAQSNRCPRCNHEKTSLHALRDCVFVRNAWGRLGGLARTNAFFSTSLKDWFELNLKQRHDWCTKFCFMAWLTWKQRNILIFENRQDDADRLLCAVKNTTVAYIKAEKSRVSLLNSQLQERQQNIQLRWVPPEIGWLKMNTDGASKGNPGVASGGGVLRSHDGSFMAGFMVKLGNCNALRAELLAFYYALLLMKKHNIQLAVIETDSKTIIDLMNGPVHGVL